MSGLGCDNQLLITNFHYSPSKWRTRTLIINILVCWNKQYLCKCYLSAWLRCLLWDLPCSKMKWWSRSQVSRALLAGACLAIMLECSRNVITECISILNLKGKLGNSLHSAVMTRGWTEWAGWDWVSRVKVLQVSTPQHLTPFWSWWWWWRWTSFKLLQMFGYEKKLKQQKEDFLGRFCGIRAIIIYNFNCKLMAFLCQPEWDQQSQQ